MKERGRHKGKFKDDSWMIHWSVIHSIFCVSITFYSLLIDSPRPLFFIGTFSFIALLFAAFQQSDPKQLINPANVVTTFRLAGILILAAYGMAIADRQIIGLSIIFILLDCLDGLLARKKNTETEFGSFFDKEIDAYFMLLLCLLLVLKGYLDSWILSFGFLRYFFVILIYFTRAGIEQEEKTSRARHIFTAVMIILLALFLPIQIFKVPLAVVIGLLLLYSFGSDLIKILLKTNFSGMPNPYSVDKSSDVSEFFDQIASDLDDPHGDPERLLNYRMRLIKENIPLKEDDTILEIGCGNGKHLFALMDKRRKGLGVDISNRMIEEARIKAKSSPFSRNVSFEVDDAQSLHTVPDTSIDVVLCVGMLEHVPDKQAVFQSVFRVLKSEGRFICLTPNGHYIWYRRIAPQLMINTKHLSSDEFVTLSYIQDKLDHIGLKTERTAYWSFIPKGDMPSYMGGFLQFLDFLGSIFKISSLRGGILLTAIKPQP